MKTFHTNWNLFVNDFFTFLKVHSVPVIVIFSAFCKSKNTLNVLIIKAQS